MSIEKYTWCVHASIEIGSKSSIPRKFCNEQTCNFSRARENHRQAKACRIASIMKAQILRHMPPCLYKLNQTDFNLDIRFPGMEGKGNCNKGNTRQFGADV